MPKADWPELADDAQNRWNQIAGFWDEYLGDAGNAFHRELVRPTAERLLDIQPGVRVLEIGCGHGNFSRRLADLGAQVTATDGSSEMIARAKARFGEEADHLRYEVLNAAEPDQITAFSADPFDAIVSNMTTMDMAVITPMFQAVHEVLKPGGRFVFTQTHPCFQAPGAVKFAEQEDRAGDVIKKYGVKTAQYLSPEAFEGIGIVGQPVPHYYFHRPLSVLLSTCFQAGFVLDGLEEPAFGPDSQGTHEFSWRNFKEIPPVLAVRLRKGG